MESLYTIGGNVKWCRFYGKQYGGSKMKHTITMFPAILHLDIYPKKVKKGLRYLYIHVHSSIIYS